jgi:hypothetical protein
MKLIKCACGADKDKVDHKWMTKRIKFKKTVLQSILTKY